MIGRSGRVAVGEAPWRLHGSFPTTPHFGHVGRKKDLADTVDATPH